MIKLVRNLDELKSLQNEDVVIMIEKDTWGNVRKEFKAVYRGLDAFGMRFTGSSEEGLFRNVSLSPTFPEKMFTPEGKINYDFFTANIHHYLPTGNFRAKIIKTIETAERMAA